MLPLVGRIAKDIVQHHERLARMTPEYARLERNRRSLNWPQRSRRYQLEEEIAAAQGELRTVQAELEALGVVLLEPAVGLVGFPTMVNERAARSFPGRRERTACCSGTTRTTSPVGPCPKAGPRPPASATARQSARARNEGRPPPVRGRPLRLKAAATGAGVPGMLFLPGQPRQQRKGNGQSDQARR